MTARAYMVMKLSKWDTLSISASFFFPNNRVKNKQETLMGEDGKPTTCIGYCPIFTDYDDAVAWADNDASSVVAIEINPAEVSR